MINLIRISNRVISKIIFSPINFYNFENKDSRIHFATKKSFSEKDDKFWEEYSKEKKQGGKYPAIEGKDMILNKTVHSWKYATKHALTSDEFLECLRSIRKGEVIPFLILDVRERTEIEDYELPKKTRKDVEIPTIYRPMSDIKEGNYQDLPRNKYIICIDSTGEVGRKASRILYDYGYLTIYLNGGYEMFEYFSRNKEI